MSKEIKFRGKCIDDTCLNGKWLYGYILHDGITGKYYIHMDNCLNESDKVGEEGLLRFVAYEVGGDTVGQYIGVKDKNRKEIYEGDIVKQFADCTELGQSLYFFYVIEWNEEYCAFVGREIYSDETYLMPDLEDIEVIGNVYENADLLENTDLLKEV